MFYVHFNNLFVHILCRYEKKYKKMSLVLEKEAKETFLLLLLELQGIF